MIITFATQKGGSGKTTLAIAFSNFLVLEKKKKVHVYDYDFQKSFYSKFLEDKDLVDIPKLYDVDVVEEEELKLERIYDMKESEEIFIFDLAGTLDQRYDDILRYSDCLVIPFEYSDVSAKSTLVFINFTSIVEITTEMFFIKSRYDKGYNYLNEVGMNEAINENINAHIIDCPVYKRNCLQTINTRELSKNQKYAVKPTFEELIRKINNSSEIKVKI
ncbi:ParA family protein [Riemerella columbipharyngis]|uniref:Chromosome partitioning protein n=1 Tax=Riemerella columbipharyngis TaxID=1071918 RepID=A0A1G6ZA22_9FLAO|nr:ParA family protein [Riemerella columbipharyngis]SDD99604.1 chromosome partitioning protein [Riemerella columbipharyngis]